MKLYHLSIRMLVFRFYLIMGIIIASGFGAHFIHPALWYLVFLAFPVLLSCLLGMEFGKPRLPEKPEVDHSAETLKHGRLAH